MTDPRSLPESSRDALAKALRGATSQTGVAAGSVVDCLTTARTGVLNAMTNVSQSTETGAVKADDGKPRWDLLPFDAIDDVAAVLEYGARKYNARNWELGLVDRGDQ